ncbi:hypothetical protein [Hoylesella shahii]|uniref:hypothetical protein n=1 Tax=Hoylesella shahii TaxID=228603 RepID=UPI0028D25452|nr:hypothetical protein [Hoylesella shahii]
MKVKRTRKVYMEPQIHFYELQEESAILAASPNIELDVDIEPSREDEVDVELQPED